MMNKQYCFFLFSGVLLVLFACRKQQATTDPGYNKIYADITLRPLMDAARLAFEGLQEQNRIELSSYPEEDLYKAFMHDSVRFIVGSRKLNEAERLSLKNRQMVFNETKIATDGIALIVNKKLLIDNLSYYDLLDIVNGKIDSWDKINPDIQLGKLQVVFDHPHSAVIRQLDDSLRKSPKRPASFFALQSPEEVVDFIEKNENSIGLIGMSWISEHNDTTPGSFLARIKVLALENPKDKTCYLPLQSYLATRDYLLTREVYVITLGHTARFPFGSYLASEKGQRVVLKSGLVPATMPIRLIKVSEQ